MRSRRLPALRRAGGSVLFVASNARLADGRRFSVALGGRGPAHRQTCPRLQRRCSTCVFIEGSASASRARSARSRRVAMRPERRLWTQRRLNASWPGPRGSLRAGEHIRPRPWHTGPRSGGRVDSGTVPGRPGLRGPFTAWQHDRAGDWRVLIRSETDDDPARTRH